MEEETGDEEKKDEEKPVEQSGTFHYCCHYFSSSLSSQLYPLRFPCENENLGG